MTFAATSSEGDHLLSADEMGVVNFWNLEDRRAHKSFIAGDGAILSLIGLSDCLCTQSKRGLISLWDYEQSNKHPILEVQADLHSFCKCVIIGENSASSHMSGVLIA